MSKPCWQKWVVLMLVVLCVTAFFACGGEEPTHGLEIVEDSEQVQIEELTEEETTRLTDALYEVMNRVMGADTELSGQSIEAQLQYNAQYLAQEVASLKPTRTEYAALTSVLQRYLETEDLSAATLKDNLYVDVLSALGKDKCATIAHRILTKYCDYRAQTFQQLYDQYGYDVMLEEAERYRNTKQVLSTQLAPEDLISGLNTYYIVGIAHALAGHADMAGFLTTDEVLMLFRAQNCTALALETDVWYALMTLAKDFVPDKYYSKILETAINNGDIRLLAEMANDLFALVRYIQMTISTEDIEAIRQGKPIAAVLLNLLEDEQLRQIDALLSEEWHYAQYDDLAKKQYGEGYQRFVQQTETLTIDQLLEARRDAPDAATLIIGYLAGKSYALAWEVKP